MLYLIYHSGSDELPFTDEGALLGVLEDAPHNKEFTALVDRIVGTKAETVDHSHGTLYHGEDILGEVVYIRPILYRDFEVLHALEKRAQSAEEWHEPDEEEEV